MLRDERELLFLILVGETFFFSCACVSACVCDVWVGVPWQSGAFCHDTLFFFWMLDDLMWCEALRVGWKGKKKERHNVCQRDKQSKKKSYEVVRIVQRWWFRVHACIAKQPISYTSAVPPWKGYGSEMTCEEMLRPSLACLCVQLVKDTKEKEKKTRARLVIGWFLCQVSPISSVVSHPLSLLQAVITVEAGITTALPSHTNKICEGSHEPLEEKEKLSFPAAWDVSRRRRKKSVGLLARLGSTWMFFFFFFFVAAVKSRIKLIR